MDEPDRPADHARPQNTNHQITARKQAALIHANRLGGSGLIDARGELYYEIAKRIWSLESLGLSPPPSMATVKRTSYGVRIKDLVRTGFIGTADRLVGYRYGQPHYARVRTDGTIQTASGSIASSPSAAMRDAVGTANRAWAFWWIEGTNERLDTIRRRYLEHFKGEETEH